MITIINKFNIDLNMCNANKRNIGHYAAKNGNNEILFYLARNSNFDFYKKDIWDNTTFDEMKN